MKEYKKLPNGQIVKVSDAYIPYCEVCGSLKHLQVHHWAPKHIFKARADDFPTSLLCVDCHAYWHSLMTHKMRVGANEQSRCINVIKTDLVRKATSVANHHKRGTA